MPKSEKSKPKLLVVFDTSILFSSLAHDLVSNEVKTFINTNLNHPDLCIQWYFPSIVIGERCYQMRNKAFEFLPTIAKLETLLGHNLNITEDILTDRVNKAVDKQLSELQISKLNIDISKVDWNKLIERAINRLPPFEPGGTEKGFRDALIAESFFQLVQQSPTTPSICRLSMLTNDTLLANYITEITKSANNVRVLPSINELGSLINTLVSQVTEEFVSEIKDNATKLFYEKENKLCLYTKENLAEKITVSFGDELKSLPKEGLLRDNVSLWISQPVFIRKERQRIFWMSSIFVDAEAYKLELQETGPLYTPPSFIGPARSNVTISYLQKPTFVVPNIEGAYLNPTKKVKVATGKSQFEIDWSVNITQTKKLTSPRIENIRFVSTKWSE